MNFYTKSPNLKKGVGGGVGRGGAGGIRVSDFFLQSFQI